MQIFVLQENSEMHALAVKIPRDAKILGWCPAGLVLPHGEKVSP